MYILTVEMYIFSLKIYIFTVEINFFFRMKHAVDRTAYTSLPYRDSSFIGVRQGGERSPVSLVPRLFHQRELEGVIALK